MSLLVSGCVFCVVLGVGPQATLRQERCGGDGNVAKQVFMRPPVFGLLIIVDFYNPIKLLLIASCSGKKACR